MKTLLVDLDDTLLDYSGGVDECWTAACETIAATAGVDTVSLVQSVRTARRWFWDDPERHRRERVNMLGAWTKIVAHGFERLGTPNEVLAAAIAEDFAARRWEAMRLFPGSVETLGQLRESGVTMALVTNGDKSQQRRKIERYDLARFFDVILIEGEFGVVPAGTPANDPPAARPDSALFWVDRRDLQEPIGVIGVIAPALDDTTHPDLFLHSILIGSAFSAHWPRTAIIPSRFQYSIIDDPDLIRIYPIVTTSDYEVGVIRESYLEAMIALTQLQIRPEEFRSLQAGVRWLIGGTLTRDLRKRMATDRGLLMTLASSGATRELWGGESFWREYRRRYDAIDRPGLSRWADYFTNPKNMAQLMYRIPPAGSSK